MSSTQNTLCWTHPAVVDSTGFDWDSEEEMLQGLRRMQEKIDRISTLINTSASKIQRAWRRFKISDLFISLKKAQENRYQRANVARCRTNIPHEVHNYTRFWSEPLNEEKNLPRVCFNEDTYTKVIGNSRIQSSQTDFRTREKKPINISVKIIRSVIKSQQISPILARVPFTDIMEVDNIFNRVVNFLRSNPGRKYRFSDCYSTSIGNSHMGHLLIAQMKLRLFANIPLSNDPLPPSHCTITPIEDLEERLEKLKSLPPPMAPVKANPRLARCGSTRIAGVPISR
tara:strand:+ start:276 stop:1130 length:855 start_codon:yes stop_codon:yes gene_type:complete